MGVPRKMNSYLDGTRVGGKNINGGIDSHFEPQRFGEVELGLPSGTKHK